MSDFFVGMSYIGGYFMICALIALLGRRFFKIPNEIFRKILHFILLGSLFFWLYGFVDWWMSALGCIVFAIVVYPVLLLAERLNGYSEIVTERKGGELKHSLLLVFIMFAIVITVCWGLYNDRLLVMAVIYAWGIGDAFAALIGTNFGKHKIYQNKSFEGTIAMFITSIVTIFVVCVIGGGMMWYGGVITALVGALVVTIVEMLTRNGYDTITCPFSMMVVIIPLINMFGGL